MRGTRSSRAARPGDRAGTGYPCRGTGASAAIRAACAQFVVLCRQLNLFTRAVVAIDGSKFKAVNNRDKNFTVAKVAKRIEQVEASIARYLTDLDRADREDGDVAGAKTVRLKEKIEGLRRQMQSLREIGKQVEVAPTNKSL
ncbi:transposase IS4 family protein [Sinorhizobium fredii USDA 257]|uniref:Transposase IS4 family protein n=1 Tax=Sinorhizobium fredii (strain USDA 257) TaxID=1185652 RepID=I3X5Y9_SINF2|nr:transposase IS4 family protein [Sinorhizobium fredii USDA 257]